MVGALNTSVPRLVGDVSSPYTPAVQNQPPAATPDNVQISGTPSPVAPPAADATDEPAKKSKTAILVAAGLAGVALCGVLVPTVINAINPPPTSISTSVGTLDAQQLLQGLSVPGPLQQEFASIAAQAQQSQQAPQLGVTQEAPTPGQEQPAQPQDPVQLITLMAMFSEASAQQLPKVTAVHQAWTTDVTAMENTSKDIFKHVDNIMRHPDANHAEDHKAITEGLATLNQQVTAFQQKLAEEGAAVDGFLGQNRDNLHQVGVLSFNIKQNVDQQAGQYGRFSDARSALGGLSDSFYDASKNIAMSTEKTTSVRAEQKVLGENMKVIAQFVSQVQEAHQKVQGGDAKAMEQVDQGSQVLKRAFGMTNQVIGQSQKNVNEAASRAHAGAEDLTEGLQKLIALTGGGTDQQVLPKAGQPQQ